MTIIPSIVSKNQRELDAQLKKFKGLVKEVQLDVMDGTFVKQRSNWFDFTLPKPFQYQAHLMVDDPEAWARKNYAKVETIILNIERVKNPRKIITFLKKKKRKVGFALNPETPLTSILPYLDHLNLALVLTVHPGKYGSTFLPHVLDKVEHLAKRYNGTIELDGGITPRTIPQCIKAGATAFVVGSYLQESKNIKKALQQLQRP